MYTKTQTKLIDLARKHNGFYSIETCYGRGPKGGKLQAGVRERNALFDLEEMGIVEITSREPWQEYNSGFKQSGNIIAFKLKV
jgi:hypothetical protein